MTVTAKNFANADEVRKLPGGKGFGELVRVGDFTVLRGELQPGWRWSNDIRPVAGTTSCEFDHYGVVLGGRLHVEMDDGSAVEIGPGDAYHIPPGHDAWVVGGEPFRSIDWTPGEDDFGKRKEGAR